MSVRSFCPFALPLIFALAAPLGSAQTADPARADAAYEDARTLLDARLFARAAEAFESFREAYPNHPREPEALFHEAESALASGDDARAANLFASFHSAYPSHVLAGRARMALGEHYYGQNRYEEAEMVLLDALNTRRQADAMARARYLLGLSVLKQGRVGEALTHFELAADTDPDGATAPLALYAAGHAHSEQGNWAGAADAFGQLARRYPNTEQNRQVGPGLGEALARLGRYGEAADELSGRVPQLAGEDRARGEWLWGDALLHQNQNDEAQTHFEAVPAGSAYHRHATFGLGRVAFNSGDYDTAAERFSAVRTASEGASRDDELGHEASYYEGLALKNLGELGEAERRLAAATLRRPDGAFADAALLELGILQYERRRYQDAATVLDRLLNDYGASPYAGEGARMLGEAYAALGDTEPAREAYQRAEALGAASPELAVELEFMEAYGLFRNERYEEAVAALKRVYESDPGGPRGGEALFWAGESAFQAGSYGQAEGLMSRFLESFRDHRQADAARYVLAWTHFKRRDYSAAALGFERFLSAYRRSAESVPYYADAHLRLADSYYALRRYDEAIAVYARMESVAQAGQGLDYALFQSAQAHAGAGRTSDAHAFFDQLLSNFPQSALRAEARYAKGSLFFNDASYTAAIAEYQQVVDNHAASPIAPKALYGIGDARYNQSRLAEAADAYALVLQRYPSSPFVANALDGLEYALQDLGRGDEFLAAQAAYEANANPAARDRLRLRQAELAFENGDYRTAADRLTAFIADARDTSLIPSALLTLGSTYTALGRPGDAAGAFARLSSDFPGSTLHPEAVVRHGETLLDANDPVGALAVLSGYEERFPDNAEQIAAALLAESRALRTLGRDAEADARVEHLLNTFPETAAAAEAQHSPEAPSDGD